MLRFFSLFCLFIFSSVSNAYASYYQIDMVAFRHAYTEKDQVEQAIQGFTYDISATPLTENSSHNRAYQLLSNRSSPLQYAWSRLNQHSQYQPLFHYTWLQPSNSQRSVLLPHEALNGWTVEGSVRIRQSNYYLLDTSLLFKAPNQSSFAFTQKQRLKPGVTYYLDHPQAGMLVRVQKIG